MTESHAGSKSPGRAPGQGWEAPPSGGALLAAALDYASAGWRVIPLHDVTSGRCSCGKPECNAGKHPRTTHGSSDGTTDPEAIASWWRKWPVANVGICTGPESGVWVVGPDGEAGKEALDTMEVLHGTIPPTLIAHTGSGGLHLLFSWPAGVVKILNHANHLGQPIDVRGNGGLVVAAPSRNLNGPYEWVPGRGPGEVGLALAPDWLLAWALTATASEQAAGQREEERRGWRPPGGGESGRPSPFDRALAHLREVESAIQHQGGSKVLKRAARDVCWGFDLGEELGYQALTVEWNGRCVPPWNEKELRHACKRAMRSDGYRKPRGHKLAEDSPGFGQRNRTTHGNAGPSAQASGDPDGNKEAEPTFEAFFQPLSAADLLKVPPPGWLVEDVLVRDQPAVMGGAMKTLKTSLALDLAVSLTSGKPFLGKFPVPSVAPVLVISGESGPYAIGNAVQRIGRARGLTDALVSQLPLTVSNRLPSLASAKHLRLLAALIRSLGAKLVVLDPLYLLLMGEGGDASQAANFYYTGPLLANVARVCLEAGATPLLLHHANRVGSTKMEPITLLDLSFSGVGEFSAQWLLLSRREAYDPDQPSHLWMVVGGRAGHSGLYALDIDEGKLSQGSLTGREWTVSVWTGREARDRRKEEHDQEKHRSDREREEAAERACLAAIDRMDPHRHGVGETALRSELGWRGDRLTPVLARLRQAKVIETVPGGVVVTIGKGGTRTVPGVRRTA